MSAGDRSFSDVLQNIVLNIQEIIRSEVRLAKTEMKEEAVKAKSAALLLEWEDVSFSENLDIGTRRVLLQPSIRCST